MNLRGASKFLWLLWLSLTTTVLAAEGAGLPEPLTLEFALSLVETDHPEMQLLRAEQQAAQARLLGVEADDDLSVVLEARARWVQPPESVGDEILDDHKGSLFVRKSLFDFGRSSSRRQAARSDIETLALRYQSQRDLRRLTIMRAYFDVLLADQEYARDNEAMAVAYVTLDRLRSRQELGQSSDIEVLEQESRYQGVRHQFLHSESRQRLSRSTLANLLNVPGQLPSTLVTPDFDHDGRQLPDYEQLLRLAEQQNPKLQAQQMALQAAQQRVEGARSEHAPRLDAELEASSYSRELGSSDRWRAGVTLTVPIYNGDRVDAAVAREEAQVLQLRAKYEQSRQELGQALLESWFAIQRMKLQRDKVRSELDFRELYLDRSRANYEMEVQADLGDAMVRMSEAQIAVLKNSFDTALAWEQLRALVGVEWEQLGGPSAQLQGDGQ